jgi:hypothetical protein
MMPWAFLSIHKKRWPKRRREKGHLTSEEDG